MHKRITLLLSALLLTAQAFAGNITITPTTTLTAQTSNNTSASNSFTGLPNGNAAPGNVSKVPLRSLLYPGSAAKIYAHLVQWFGYGNHVDVGYSSGDAVQVQKQVRDMISRGLDGAILDWYGRGNTRKVSSAYDQASQLLMHEAEQHPGFNFAIMLDAGATRGCESVRNCNPTENVIQDLNYAHRVYQQSPAYLRQDGRPVVFFFGLEAHEIDWDRVRSHLDGNPILIFRNAGAFRGGESDGGYSWISPFQASEADPMALNYLVNYYRTAQRHESSFSLGSAYKGFDDSIALWSADRHVRQQCGQTWLQSMAAANQFYSSQKQMIGIQLVTWNDYEEGTEFETGIANCVKVQSWVKGTTVSWKLQGDAATVDHYTVFLSRDGENLMPLADLAADAHSLDLADFLLEPADYKVYVKAVGKPSLTNQMSEGNGITVPDGRANIQFPAAMVVSSTAGVAPGARIPGSRKYCRTIRCEPVAG